MTNETLHTLETRRSCRAYKPEQITKEELEAVLRAGTFAPSAMNRQSAKIVYLPARGAVLKKEMKKRPLPAPKALTGVAFSFFLRLSAPAAAGCARGR